MRILSVIPLKKGILKGDLTYFTSLNILAGNIVNVPLRGKKTLALVTSSENLQESKGDVKGMDFNLKKVTEDLGSSVFRKEFLDTIFDTSRYFAQNTNESLTALIPRIFIEEYSKISKIIIPLASTENKPSKEKKLMTEKLLLQYPFEDRISIYKTLVRESFARGKSVFMVLPTESDIEKFYTELSKGVEQFTFALHSGISPKKNLLSYEKIVTSTHPVLIIGTAYYLSIPKSDIGTIVLEHENSSAFRMIARPHFDLRIFAEVFASKINAKFILADEILRFETIGRIDTDNVHPLHPLSYRIEFAPKIKICGKEQKNDGKFHIFSQESLEEIHNSLEHKRNIFIFSLRKGLATMTVCRDCGDTVSCKKCEGPLVLYLSHQGKKRMFVCNRCAEEIDGDVACISCGSWNLMPLGIGTDTVYEELKNTFPKTQIFQLDKESAKTPAGAKKIMKDFTDSSSSILIGTEMAFFYLQRKVPLSIVASFDSLWSMPNFKMSEKIIQIVLSIVRITEEKLLIQTKNEKDNALLGIKSGNLMSFVREELEDRKKLLYPPFRRFIKITYIGDKEETTRARQFLTEFFEAYSPEIFSGFISRLQGKYATNALIKLDPHLWALPEISMSSHIDPHLLQKLTSLGAPFEVLVDPEDLL